MNKKYPFLDGIRGAAAILVLTRHTKEYWNFNFYHSYLAVDLFFILSGFVIAFAYENKLRCGTISFKKFMMIRIIRLYPMYLLSLVLSMTVALLLMEGPYEDSWDIALSGLLASLFIPSLAANDDQLFPLNGPYWSLFFEIIINFLYAALCPLLSTRVMLVMIAVFGLIMAKGAFYFGHLDTGWQWGTQPLSIGLSRAGFGILLGCLLFRSKSAADKILPQYSNQPFLPWASFFLAIAILMSPNANSMNTVFDLCAIVIAFPLLILIASRGDGGRLQPLLLTLGAASYPIYVLHVPLSKLLYWLWPEWITKHASISGCVFTVFVIMAALRLDKSYDIPVRRWLSKKTLHRAEVDNLVKAG